MSTPAARADGRRRPPAGPDAGTMMPTNPIGPPTDTAAPVASDAEKNATRWARTTLTPRVPAASAPMLSRFSGRASHAKAMNATATSGSADRIGAYPATSRSPMSQRSARNVCAKSLRYCTNRISAEKNAFSVTPASSSTVVDSPPMPRARQRVDDGHGQKSAGEARRCDAADHPGRAERDRHHRAERCARRDAERVRRRERIAQQPLKHDTGRGERAADQRGGQRARQPRDEKDLRVDVVRKRHRRC